MDQILEKNQIKAGIEVDAAYLTSLKEDISKMVYSIIGEDYKENRGWGAGVEGFEFARKHKDGRVLTTESTAFIINRNNKEQRQRAQSYLKGGNNE